MTTMIRMLSVLAVSLALGACTQEATEDPSPKDDDTEVQTSAPARTEDEAPAPAKPADPTIRPMVETVEW